LSPNTVVAEFPEFPQEVGKAATPTWACRHFSVKELASIFKLSHDSVTRLFRSEPDVMVMAQRKRRGARTKKNASDS
jgi:hypothetical protein